MKENEAVLPLILHAAKDEARRLLARVLSSALERVEGPKPKAPVIEVDGRHKTIVDAIAETEGAIAEARSETRERRKWMYLVLDDKIQLVDDAGVPFTVEPPAKTSADAVTFFGQPEGTPVVEGRDARGRHVVAVWDAANHGLIPTSEPTF